MASAHGALEWIPMNLPRNFAQSGSCCAGGYQTTGVPFARLNADPRVVEFLPHAAVPEASDARADRIEAHFLKHGFGLWAVRSPESFRSQASSDLPSRVLKLRSRLHRDRLAPRRRALEPRYATEGARAALAFGFRSLHVEEIVSSTVPGNVRSRRVMEKIGMTHSASEDFEHPCCRKGIRFDDMCCIEFSDPGSPNRSRTSTITNLR